MEAKLSIIPLLLKTQDQFISIISVETPALDKLFDIVEASSLSANLFLKHLAILADYGGEMLESVTSSRLCFLPENCVTTGAANNGLTPSKPYPLESSATQP